MTFETWLSFAITSSIISIIPGPSVFMVLAQSISYGLRSAFLCIFGDVIGGLIVMTLSYAGIGAILAASEELFLFVKWSGIFYIAYLGVTQVIETSKITDTSETELTKSRDSIRIGFFTGLLNPKAIIFSIAFLSQFIDTKADQITQLLILMLTSATLIIFILGGYALLAFKARNLFRSTKNRRVMGFLSGGLLCGGSLMMFFIR